MVGPEYPGEEAIKKIIIAGSASEEMSTWISERVSMTFIKLQNLKIYLFRSSKLTGSQRTE